MRADANRFVEAKLDNFLDHLVVNSKSIGSDAKQLKVLSAPLKIPVPEHKALSEPP